MADDPWNESSDDDAGETGPATILFKAKVLFPFESTCDVELDIKTGDIIDVTRADVGGGWWEGQLRGVTGLFPEAYVEQIKAGSSAPVASARPVSTVGGAAAAAQPTPAMRTPVAVAASGVSSYASDEEAIRQNQGRNVIVEGPRWAVAHSAQPITVKASQSKGSKFGGIKEFTLYEITDSATNLVVDRRFKHFAWLHEQLCTMYPCISVPPIPDKQVTGRFDQVFIETRRRMLERFLNRCAAHPVVGNSAIFRHFLTASDQKTWKSGKREHESSGSQSFIQNTTILQDKPGDCEKTIAKFSKFSTWFDKQTHALDKASDTLFNHKQAAASELEKFAQTLVKFGEAPTANPTKGEKPEYREWWGLDPALSMDKMMESMTQVGSRILSVVDETTFELGLDRQQITDALREYIGILKTIPALVKENEKVIHDCNTACAKEQTPADVKENHRQRVNIMGNIILAEFRHIHENIIVDFKNIIRGFAEQQAAHHRRVAELWDSVVPEVQ